MNMVPFIKLFPEQGEKEIRTITLQNYPGIPSGEYGLLEFYCTDFTCDCRRLTLNVFQEEGREFRMLATISYGFDRDAEMAGPFLDPLNVQSEYSEAFLELVDEVLEKDTAYVARLQRHYDQVKHTIENPPKAMRRLLAELEISTPVHGVAPAKTRSVKTQRPKKAKTSGIKKLKKRRKKK